MSLQKIIKKIKLKKISKSKSLKNIRSFTLIELLVVVSIISMLSSIVLASVSVARDRAYNAYTTQLIRQYILAFELYKNDNGTYPVSVSGWHCIGEGYPGNICAFIDSLTPATEVVTLNNSIRPYIKPVALTKVIDVTYFCTPQDVIDWGCVNGTQDRFMGIQYTCSNVSNNVCTNNSIVWILAGNNSCSLEKATAFNLGGNTMCAINLVQSYGAR